MKIDEIIPAFGAIIFLDKETDILIAWSGEIQFDIFSGRFDGNYDHIDTFYKMVKHWGQQPLPQVVGLMNKHGLTLDLKQQI